MIHLEILKKARELISLPEHWTKGEEARDKDGHPTKVYWEPFSYCSIGAIARASNELEGHGWQGYALACARLERFLPKDYSATAAISAMNDRPETTHADVLSLFDKAIGSFSE